jgi:hypothetical protein
MLAFNLNGISDGLPSALCPVVNRRIKLSMYALHAGRWSAHGSGLLISGQVLHNYSEPCVTPAAKGFKFRDIYCWILMESLQATSLVPACVPGAEKWSSKTLLG